MTRATFSCDSCRTLVPLTAKSCPKCGKVFDAVRCPRCGHIGNPSDFTNGCPACHYLTSSSTGPIRGSRPRKSLFVPAMAVLLVLLVAAVGYAWVLRAL